MKGEEAMEIFNLVKQRGMLPVKLDDLVPLSFIGQAAVNFYRDKIKLMDQLKMTESQRKVTLRDGQEAGGMLLDIEGRIGELLPSEEEMAKKRSEQYAGRPARGQAGLKQLPIDITKNRASSARAISKHPEVVERVKAQAKKNEDIPTKTAVINQIRYEKEKNRADEANKKRTESKSLIAIEQVQYINALDQVIRILPQQPPKDWNENAFKEAKAKAQIIIKRLEVFN